MVYKRLLSYVVPYKLAFTLAIFGNILYGVVDASLVRLFKPLIDDGFVARDEVFLRWIPFIVVGIFMLRGLASFCSTFFMGWVGRNVVMTLRQQMFNHLLKLPNKFYDNATSGELLSKITFNVEQVADACTDAITVLVRETCTVVGLVTIMFLISWRLTLLFFITLPIMAFVMHYVSQKLRSVSHDVQDSMANLTHTAEEAIEGQKVIKAFGGARYEQKVFCNVTQNNRSKEMKRIRIAAISIPAVQVIGSIALALTVYLATLNPDSLLKTSITTGAFASMIGAMIMVLKPIKLLTKVNSNIQKGLAGASSIFEFLSNLPEQDSGKNILSNVAGRIEFKHVSFSYMESNVETAAVLSDINFSVSPGETIALVGRSGGGKSTLANLLPRFYDAEGEILIDGINIQDVTLQSLRQNIALVTQQVTLFNDTIANNIAYGLDSVRDSEILRAAENAFVMDFVNKLPLGLDTLVGENGVRLSGGQRQRIAIARAMLKNAPILILDEATSALDTESERTIQLALDSLMKHCTTIVIAHRLTTIENADRILVMENGKIVEMGTHTQLMLKQGVYQSLQDIQRQGIVA
jgi:subfamily B ATP-binding cassette protein MsbA